MAKSEDFFPSYYNDKCNDNFGGRVILNKVTKNILDLNDEFNKDTSIQLIKGIMENGANLNSMVIFIQ